MQYWYIARQNELLLDIDRAEFLPHLSRRLQGAIDCEKLAVHSARIFPSIRNGHFHVFIFLSRALPDPERFIWEIILRSDIYRGCCNLMRWINGIKAPGLLISQYEYIGIRKPDYFCLCEEKHTNKIMAICPIAKKIRGKYAARGFFGKPSERTFFI
ncbi:MAG: hypothetical protein ACREA9_28955 [Pyrinomonadaceae bacterium]